MSTLFNKGNSILVMYQKKYKPVFFLLKACVKKKSLQIFSLKMRQKNL